ncbi:MAG: helix-turn-helix domain-containing protein [Acidobacteriota bacterium]|nr:helix-turn-helix domain-containing protein [Acidobacteriota bacterium]
MSPDKELTFKVLYTRLLALINARIQNGEFSERALAKRLGISQPHLHHVLNGKRTLRASLADVVLARFHISVVDLLTNAEIAAAFDQLQSGDLRLRIYPSFNQGEAGLSKDKSRIRLLRKRPSTVGATPPKLEAS